MSDRISLRGIDVYAHHGVHPAERELGQRFVIDAELEFDCSAAARSDRLEKALDYTRVHALVVHTTAETRFQLIEALAGRLCTVLLRELPVDQVTLTVHKPNPPIPGFLGQASVTLVRDRSWLKGDPEALPGGSG
jgi:dihydroneopterin aldolase